MTQPPAAVGDIVVSNDPESRRYEAFVEGAPAGFADYHAQPGLITVLHTEIDPSFEGRGVGSAFVRGMLDDIHSQGARVLPVCPFVRAFLQRHPEYAELVWKP
jgi:uncharacterized protein